uniref:GOLD domain-containing protein n=1 Tax=Haemonchus contortus TaxID=6289 RepID=A0A7I4YD25_HAECO
MLKLIVLIGICPLTLAIQCYTESDRNIIEAYMSPSLTNEEYGMCTITTYLDPQKKEITNVQMFGEEQKEARLNYEFDQKNHVLRAQYSCFTEQCNSLDELMAVLREEGFKKNEYSVLARMTLLALKDGLMKAAMGKFKEQNEGTPFTLCVCMFALLALVAIIHMTRVSLMYLGHLKKKV